MAEVMALKATSWLTAMAVEHLSGYFAESVEEGIGKWSNKLQSVLASPEMKAIEGERAGVQLVETQLPALCVHEEVCSPLVESVSASYL